MPRSIGRRSLFLAAFIVSVVAVAACSSSASVPNAGAPVGDGSGTTDTGGRFAPIAGPTAAPSAAPASVSDESSGSGGTAGGPATDGLLGNEALIVRTGSLALEVDNIDSALLKARGKIIGLGGYVSDSQRSDQGDSSIAVITYRIPSDRWDDALDGLGSLAGKVLSEDTKAVEVTGQVVDLGARITNLQATERALVAIMAQAVKISDIIDVQNQLTSVRGQIEELTAQKTHLSDQAAMGTLAVTYTVPVVAAVKQATTGWSLAAEIDRAVALLVQVGQGMAVIAVWLAVVGLPVGLSLAVLIGLVVAHRPPARVRAAARPAGRSAGRGVAVAPPATQRVAKHSPVLRGQRASAGGRA